MCASYELHEMSCSTGVRLGVGSAMARCDDILLDALDTLGPKPPAGDTQAAKKRYSELMSNVIAPALAEELRQRGMRGARPAGPGDVGPSGAERRMSGGIGAKKVDCTWATEESGLLLGVSVKTINFADGTSGNFQKNLTNRRGDLIGEAVTLHRRFPYAVMFGFLFLDKAAQLDHTKRRRSTFENAHARMRMFTGRSDPAGRDEQFERLYLALLDANRFGSQCAFYEVGRPETAVPLSEIFDNIVTLLVERNPDFYEIAPDDGQPMRIVRAS